MSEKIYDDILEWLTKEDERFSWRKLGLFSDIEDEAAKLATTSPRKVDEGYVEWKQRTLSYFYTQKGLKEFYTKHRKERLLVKGIKSIISSKLDYLFHHQEQTDTDKYIAPEKDTISYSLSDENFQLISDKYLHSGISDTFQISSRCSAAIDETYPLTDSYVIEHLECNDNFYWEKVYNRLRPMTDGFSYQISGTNAQDNTYDIWCDTCLTLNSAVLNKKLQQPTTSKDIISYAVGIIKNKNRELLKGIRKGGNISLDSVAYKVEFTQEENFFNTEDASPKKFSSQNKNITNYIDLRDEEAVRHHMVLALYNENHPLHQELVQGYEETVKMLFEHYIDGTSYDDIVIKRMGNMPEKEMIKNVARIRQEVKRVKEKLIKRFIKIIKNRKDE